MADRMGGCRGSVRRRHGTGAPRSLDLPRARGHPARVPSTDVVFFGGTALSRTYLTASRLSEDLDLIAVAPRSQVAADLEAAIRTGLARSHGAMTWRPALTATTGSQPAVLIVDDQTSVQLQLVEGSGYTWPTEVHDLEQRYADAPPFGWPCSPRPARRRRSWLRGSSGGRLARYDLWALAERGLSPPRPWRCSSPGGRSASPRASGSSPPASTNGTGGLLAADSRTSTRGRPGPQSSSRADHLVACRGRQSRVHPATWVERRRLTHPVGPSGKGTRSGGWRAGGRGPSHDRHPRDGKVPVCFQLFGDRCVARRSHPNEPDHHPGEPSGRRRGMGFTSLAGAGTSMEWAIEGHALTAESSL